MTSAIGNTVGLVFIYICALLLFSAAVPWHKTSKAKNDPNTYYGEKKAIQ